MCVFEVHYLFEKLCFLKQLKTPLGTNAVAASVLLLPRVGLRVELVHVIHRDAISRVPAADGDESAVQLRVGQIRQISGKRTSFSPRQFRQVESVGLVLRSDQHLWVAAGQEAAGGGVQRDRHWIDFGIRLLKG